LTVHVAGLSRPTAARIVWPSWAWLSLVLVLALGLGLLPLVLAACCAPAGATGLGTVWFINDFAQYESAMRQGGEQAGWLVTDRFTAEPHQAAFMFGLYVGVGKLAAALQLPAEVLERIVEVAARAAFVLALWRFCRAFTSSLSAARVALLLALFGGGFEVVAALAGAVFGPLYSGSWSYETHGLGLLLAAPHVPLAMAATLELARGWLRPFVPVRPLTVLSAAGLGALIAVLHPFHEPVLLAALLLAGLVYWRTRRGLGCLAGALAAALGALPVLWPTVQTFSFDPFWAAAYSAQNHLPSPAPHELLVDLGPALVLALGGAFALRGRIAPFGILIWLLLGAIAMYAPVPYQRRLAFGLQPAVAVLAGNALIAACAALSERRAVALRLGVAAAAASGTLLIVSSVVVSGVRNWPLTVYRSTADLDAAAHWLDGQALPGEVILADWNVSNYLAPRTRGRVVGGHPVATLRAADKQILITTVFAHSASREVARQYGAQWLVYGPDEAALAGPPGAAFQSGVVRVYRVDG
jgi:chromate transport protein ChrA